ncbi:hypothetical protein AGDE_15400 [Angomonas deanei]|uniref:Uncharacterized protein n=1 Tax=Angomonas deanei TaxID=59799 RepID=A0A7G2CF10_9TRYP|nr:hypothetical protein AGDE_15400 [Angomonas deanei]CAD2218129.1 hypothetical protein, conserved [Angomonas deanei]|eukprot:EPY19146.1 hypothetical protein AGDE_15400 [Angomonas deanei]
MGTVVDSYAAKVRQLRRLQQKNEETARQLITKNSQFATTSRSLSQNIKAQRDNQDLEHIRVELHTVQDDVESLKYKLYVLKKRNALGVEEKAAEVPKKPLMGPSAQSLLETKLKELAEWKLIYHKESAELKELREQCALLERHGA